MSEPTDQTNRTDAVATCADVAPYLSAYVDNELAAPLRAMVAAHVASCQTCARKAQRYQEIHRQVASLSTTAPSPEVFERIQEAIAHRGPSPVVRESLGSARQSSAAALVRLLSPKVVYPQAPEHSGAETDEPAPALPAPSRTLPQRWAPYARGAAPALVALLLIALTATLFSGLAHGGNRTTPTGHKTHPSYRVPDVLRQTENALRAVAAQLTFTPLAPGYLPAGAQLSTVHVLPPAPTERARYLEITWTFPSQSGSGLKLLRLRETPDALGFTSCHTASSAFGAEWLAWGLPNQPMWQALTCDEQRAWPAVGQTYTEPIPAASQTGIGGMPGGAPGCMIVGCAAKTSTSPSSSVGGQAPTVVRLIFMAQPLDLHNANNLDTAVTAMRIASLSMDASFEQQLKFEAEIGQQAQSPTGLFLHFTAQASDGVGNSSTITGQTNEPYLQPSQENQDRREQIEIRSNASGGTDTVDIVNGQSALRLDMQNQTYYPNLSYPLQQSPLATGQDGEPGSGVTRLLTQVAALMAIGEIWVVPNSVTSYQGHRAYELVLVDAPAPTYIYVDAKTNNVIGVTMDLSTAGPGGAGAPTRLTVSGGCSNLPKCSITYTELWLGAATTDFSQSAPTGYTQVTTPITPSFQCEP